MILILDYGISNIRSVSLAIQEVANDTVRVSGEPNSLASAQKLVLPGVCSYRSCMDRLNELNLVNPIRHEILGNGKPILGICSGFQVFSSRGYENGITNGLNIIPGEVVRLEAETVPHMGWNKCRTMNSSTIFDMENEQYFYFAHSYHFQTNDASIVTLETTQGIQITAGIEKENIFGCQFHPERSGEDGLNVLRQFCNM